MRGLPASPSGMAIRRLKASPPDRDFSDARRPAGCGQAPARAAFRARSQTGGLKATCPGGVVTLPCGEREASAPQELSGRCNCSPPRGHRRSAKRAVRLGGDEMALDVEGIVDGGVCGKKFLG